MRTAVFLDVDKTLTRDYIQLEYAKLLNCEAQYRDLEQKFQSKQITAMQFGEQIITLFASKGFKEQNAEMMFDKIALQPWSDELLKMKKIDKYLVSSGPNYYIDVLAQKYKIPDENICRSVYKFNKDTRVIESCAAVDGQQKAFFVKGKVQSYDITIGIGDNPEHDAFVSYCTISLLTAITDSFIHTPNFSSVIRLIHNLEARSSASDESEGFPADKLSIPQLASRLSISSWGVLLSALTASFASGAAVAKLF